jgi:hypothetical protein
VAPGKASHDADHHQSVRRARAYVRPPPSSAPGLAIKLFLHAYSQGVAWGKLEQRDRNPFVISALADAVRFVPELAPLVAPALAEEIGAPTGTELGSVSSATAGR